MEEIADLCYENTASAGAASPLQNPKTRLLEVTVERQRVGETFALHDDERDAVDEAPFLVVVLFVEGQSVAEKIGRQLDDLGFSRREEIADDRGGLRTKPARQTIADLQKDGVRREGEASVKSQRQVDGPLMILVAIVDQCDDE